MRIGRALVVAAALVAGLAVAGYVWVPRWLEEQRRERERTELELAIGTGDVAELAKFASEHAASTSSADAERAIAARRLDETRYASAVAEGTAEALDRFLEEIPGHVRESDARRLRERMNPRSVFELLAAGELELEPRGSGIDGVHVTVERRVPHELNATFPVGTFFVAGGDYQNMVATRAATVRIATDGPCEVTVPAACANRTLAVPGTDDTFRLELAPSLGELQALAPLLDQPDISTAIAQAAVWIVTDDANYDDLGALVFTYGLGFGGSRAIDGAAAATALKLCADAGVDLSKRRIGADVFVLIHGLAIEAHGVSEWSRARLERLGWGATASEIASNIVEREEDGGPLFSALLEIVESLDPSTVRLALRAQACARSEPSAAASAASSTEVESAVHSDTRSSASASAPSDAQADARSEPSAGAPSEVQSDAREVPSGARARARAIELLGAVAEPADVELFASLARDADPRVRAAAIDALGPCDGPVRAAAFGTALTDEQDEVVQAVLSRLAERSEPTLAPALLRLARSERASHLRAGALQALGAEIDADARAALGGLIADPDEDVAMAALLGVSRARDPALVPMLIGALQQAERPSDFRTALVFALDTLGGPEARAELLRRLEDADEHVVSTALGCLASETDPELAPVWLDVLNRSRSPELRARATLLFAALGGASARAELRKLAGDAQASVRAAAALALGEAGDPSDLPPLLALTRDGDAEVRAAALHALRSHSGPEKLAALTRALSDEFEDVAAAALAGLEELAEPSLAPALGTALRPDRSTFFRTRVVGVLGQVGGRGAIEVLIAVLDDGDEDLKWNVAFELGRIGDASALPALDARAARESNAFVRGALLDAAATIRAREGQAPNSDR
ncbi:MAG: HEAT repeat domain-containing protein [Planctomycetes bacterium]|nr:HEAT repeat domain-containing protein [Planctomycetota bacterium]